MKIVLKLNYLIYLILKMIKAYFLFLGFLQLTPPPPILKSHHMNCIIFLLNSAALENSYFPNHIFKFSLLPW